MSKKFVLAIVVDYELNGVGEETVVDILDGIPGVLLAHGLLSGETDAEVKRWDHSVGVFDGLDSVGVRANGIESDLLYINS